MDGSTECPVRSPDLTPLGFSLRSNWKNQESILRHLILYKIKGNVISFTVIADILKSLFYTDTQDTVWKETTNVDSNYKISALRCAKLNLDGLILK